MILKRVGIAVLLTASSFLLAAQQDSQSMIAAIKAERNLSTPRTEPSRRLRGPGFPARIIFAQSRLRQRCTITAPGSP